MDEIFYNYGANHDHLDGIHTHIGNAEAMREDVHKVFTALAYVYDGEAAGALQAAHQQCTQLMDGHICDMRATHQHAVDRQIITAQQDHQGAAGFA